jgi:hypothetical protein
MIPTEQLEDRLRRALEQQAQRIQTDPGPWTPPQETVSEPPAESHERPNRRTRRGQIAGASRRARPVASAVGVAALVGVTLVIAAGALIVLGGHHSIAIRHHTAAPSTADASREQLIRILGVLRRPQTYADLHSPDIARFLALYRSGQAPPFFAGGGTPDVPLIRRAATTPWGTGVFVIPMKPPTAASLAALKARYPNFPINQLAQLRGEGIDLEIGSGGGCCSTAAHIQAGHDMTTEGAGRSFAGGSTQTRLVLLVPDGVAKVQFVLPRQPSRNSPGSPIYPTALRVTVPVHGNVAAVQVKRELDGGGVPMIWYNPDGQVIKRIGDLGTVNRVLPSPQPGPQTARSRAAERDPSTPNRVWVTPATGNQHAKYAVHFRLLLNDADYRFQISGTSCPQITLAGGGGGGYGDLRGRILSYDLDAVTGQTWCPGTYHVSVSVMDLGRYGSLKHPAAPFGTATFTVKP